MVCIYIVFTYSFSIVSSSKYYRKRRVKRCTCIYFALLLLRIKDRLLYMLPKSMSKNIESKKCTLSNKHYIKLCTSYNCIAVVREKRKKM